MDEKNALYPRSMSIGDTERIPIGSEQLRALVTECLEEHRGLKDKIIAKVMQIQKSLHPQMPAIDAEDWIDRIKRGDSDATAALLVTLFPNVKTLRVSNRPALNKTLLLRTLERLTILAAKHDPQALDAFQELSKIELRGSRRYSAQGKLIPVFMILPSMRVIEGYNVRWLAGEGLDVNNLSVKEISLQCSEIDSKPLISCLKGIEALEKFAYDMVPAARRATDWEPRLIIKVLRKYARSTLVRLELTGETSELSSTPVDGEPFIGTLRSFQVLESIRLMAMMLFKQVDANEVDESEDTVESTLEDLVDPNSLVEPRRLVDFLPSSAKKLELVGGISDDEAQDMFADLPRLKHERVPKLGEIVLEDNDPLEQETKDLCKNAGIKLKSIKRVVNNYQRIYVVTKPTPQADSLER